MGKLIYRLDDLFKNKAFPEIIAGMLNSLLATALFVP